MAFVRVHENTHLEESGRDEGGRTARRVFEVVANAATTNVAAETATATNPAAYGGATVTIPAVGAAHPSDPTRVVNKIGVERDEESRITTPKFRVTVDYATPEDNTGPTPTGDPLAEPTRYKWSFNPATAPMFRDVSAERKPIVNSAGEPFEFLLEADVDELTVEVTKNVSSYSPATALTLHNHTNSNSFSVDGYVVAIGQAKMIGPMGEKNYDANAVAYFAVTYIVRFKEDGWKNVKLDDRGYNEKNPDKPGKLKEIVKGTPPVKPDHPWPLNGLGYATMMNSDSIPAELTFQVTKEAVFPNL